VEPAVLQSLPETAFVLVEAAAGGRRVRFGDCNPGIAMLERVADAPRGIERATEELRVDAHEHDGSSLLVPDPQGRYEHGAQRARDAGYDVYWEPDPDGRVGRTGWRVMRPDRRHMAGQERNAVNELFRRG
jgi:hypothetical protein